MSDAWEPTPEELAEIDADLEELAAVDPVIAAIRSAEQEMS